MTISTDAERAAAPRRALWLWLGLVVACIIIAARSHYVADLSAFLPSAPTAEQAVLLDQVKSGTASRLVLIGIEGGDARARSEASLILGRAMRASGLFEAVNNGDNAGWQGAGRVLFEHRYLLSPAVDAERYTASGLRAAIDDTVALLGTPAGALIKPLLLRDPTGETVRMAEAMTPARTPRLENGVWVSRQAPRAVLVAIARAEGGDLDGQQRALASIHDHFAAQATPGLTLSMSGASVFAVASRAQIKAEVERLAIAGSVIVIGLLLLAFGSLRALAIAMLPVATGVLAGIAAVSLAFGQVHAITLGFGTTLIGEAVDYAIYYLIQARAGDGGGEQSTAAGWKRWLHESWPTIRLGLWTSLCGFAALVFSGFPGLAQLGVFSIAGLTAAAFGTRYVFPILAPHGSAGGGLRRPLGEAMRGLASTLPRARLPLRLLAVAAFAAVLLLPSPWHGDLASLSPIGRDAMALDAALRADVGAADAGSLLALTAADEAGALVAAEAAAARLDKLVADGVLRGYDSPARLLPSPATQLARRAALPDAQTLKARLEEATTDGPIAAQRLNAFIADVQTARTQAPLDRTAIEGTPLATAVDAFLSRGRDGKPWRVFLNLQAPSAAAIDLDAVRRAVADMPGARVVQIKQELDRLYARYLHEAMLQALLGALAVVALLALHLRSPRRLLGVAEPIAAAVVIVLAGFAISGVALGVLHLVGLLLVVAIGSNYALFFDHLRIQGDADEDTLASLALANATTVASFALLAFSGIPALHAIGQVVAPGALLCLLLSAAFSSNALSPRGKMTAP